MRVWAECVISTDSWVYPLGIVKLITNENRLLALAWGGGNLLSQENHSKIEAIYVPFKYTRNSNMMSGNH